MNQKEDTIYHFDKYFKKASKKLLRGKLREAINSFKYCLAINPDHLETLNDIVYTYNRLGEYDDVLKICHKILNLSKNSKSALNNMFYAYDQMENFDEALKILKIYIDEFFVDLEDSLKTYKTFCKITTGIPGGTLGLYQKKGSEAFHKINTGDLKNYTIVYLIPSIVSPNEIIDLNLETSFLYSKIGFSERKASVLELVLEKFPLSKHLWVSLGEYYIEQNDYNKAELFYKKSLEIDSEDPDLWRKLGTLYRLTEEFQKAIPAFEYALILHPKSTFLRMGLPDGVPDYKLKNFLDKLIWMELEMTYNDMGEYEKARDACINALKIDAIIVKYYTNDLINSNDQTNSLTMEVLSTTYEGLGKHKKAFKTIKNAVKLNNFNVSAWKHLGSLYYESKDFKRSIKAFKCVVELDPQDFEAWYNLARSFFKEKRLDDAIRANTRCLDIKPHLSEALELKNKLLDSKQDY
jgi:tetratricopeptide (TPR) repeat protein